MTQRNQADKGVRAGEVFSECIEKTGLPILDFPGRAKTVLAEAKTASGGKNATRRAGPKDGGLAYTEWDLEVQNGNSGYWCCPKGQEGDSS
jgi:hypothetical protein